MNTAKLFAFLDRRGLKIASKDGNPVLTGNMSTATPALLAVLRSHREAVLAKALDREHDERCAELLPRIGFPPDEFMGRAYQDWLKAQ